MVKILFLVALLAAITFAQPTSCSDYIQQLYTLFRSNKKEALMEMGPYIALSGKKAEDLGFPERCLITKNVTYSTLQFDVNMNGQQLKTYYGLCFNDICTVEGLNQNMVTILNLLRMADINIPENVTVIAVNPRLQHKTSDAAIVMITLFCALIAVQLFYSVKKWILQCTNKQDIQQRYTFEDGQVFQQQEMTLIRKVSLEYKLTELFSTPEKTNKIVSFSVYKVLCIPLMVAGQEFYFRNFGAYNVFAFRQQIYGTFYSKVAVFSVYLPDALFFISAYLLSIKCLQHQASLKYLLNELLKKLGRLYPIYIGVFIIYWAISPSLHEGPVWYAYENQVAVCNSRWWAALLLIDNWFTNHCFPGGWFIQAEFQFVLFTLFFFFVFSKFKVPALAFYLIVLIVMLVLTIVLSSRMPVSIENTIDPQFRHFYLSSHAHFFFYLIGMGVAFIKKMQSLSLKVSQFFENKKIVEVVIECIGLGIILLVLFRPSLWSGGSQFEFALSRIGVFLGFLTFFVGGIFKPDDYENSSIIHRFAYYSYPIMLISFVVTMCSVWGLSSFSYVNGLDLLNLMVTETLICIVVGTFIGLLLDTNALKKIK